mmetsp:Transcript_5012/g.11249  ORF Transcript_5012/g.11249 Transcript_5012/m.11249 type:complete len:172 (+) Transcript_5012:650-1165(+)
MFVFLVLVIFFAQVDGQRMNAEKIWQEMKRRRAARKQALEQREKTKPKNPLASPRNTQPDSQKRRTTALSELSTINTSAEQSSAPQDKEKSKDEEEEDDIWGKLKGMYKKADSMAASQALMLNKALEERGIVDKITDESGLKVIGREAASKLQAKKEQPDESDKETKETKK